jgi:hypothetical protein
MFFSFVKKESLSEEQSPKKCPIGVGSRKNVPFQTPSYLRRYEGKIPAKWL